jgi:hypothetical protein
MIKDLLTAEIARQKKTLDRLPADFVYPLFNSRHAVESQRRSGYRNTASAAREIVDNALEAGASRIDIVFERPKRLAQHERKESVRSVAFIDNGSGMLPEMARYALSWGAGTHFDEPGTIGKFGFGLPNASINQTRRVEVYTKTRDAAKVTMAWLDINDTKEYDVQTIKAPVEQDLPEFVQRYLKTNGIAFDHGTVVVWCMPDRLTYKLAAPLKEHLLDDFGVTYRYLLSGITLIVEGVEVLPIDPLFLTPGARYYLKPEEGGALQQGEWTIAVRYVRDLESGALHLEKVTDAEKIDPENKDLIAVGAVDIKISRLPVGFAEYAKKKVETDAHRRFEIRKSRRGMSFVRGGREIETLDAFPRSMRDIANNMGKWPLLQGYAYHWGIEVKFGPQLDEAFGITNDKQSVRPVEDFWRLLTAEDIDDKIRAENNWQTKARDKKNKLPEAEETSEPTAAEQAAALADAVRGKRTPVPEQDVPQVEAKLEEEAKAQVEATTPHAVTPANIEEAKKAILTAAKKRPYKIEYFTDPNGPFYEPVWGSGGTVIARVNRGHPFYSALYGELLNLTGAGQAKYAVDVLLLALAKAELSVDEDLTKIWYAEQRRQEWSPFLANALRILEQTLHPSDVEEGDTVHQADEEDASRSEAAE